MSRGKGQFEDNMLFLLGEEIKQPLIDIAQLSELANNNVAINAHAKRALSTIDNIILYKRVHSGQVALKIEPIHVGSTIQEVSNAMVPLMREAGCRTDIKIQRSLSLVDADRQILHGALLGLWQAFLNTLVNPTEVICRANSTKEGVRLSLMSVDANVEHLSFKDVNVESSQPLPTVAGPATDLLASRGMFELLGGNLTKTVGSKLSGFSVTLKASQQLQLI